MFKILPRLLKCSSNPRLRPIRCLNSDSAAYDGDGKTTIRVLDEGDKIMYVQSYSSTGFRVTGNLVVNGSLIMFPTNIFSWAVKRGEDITEESLLLFDLIVPKMKILVVGYGSYGEPHDMRIPIILKKKGISCEMLPTPHAVTTYNYLANDGVHVAGAFVPVLSDDGPMLTKDTVQMHGYEFAVKGKDFHAAPDRENLWEENRYRDMVSAKDKNKKKFDDPEVQ